MQKARGGSTAVGGGVGRKGKGSPGNQSGGMADNNISRMQAGADSAAPGEHQQQPKKLKFEVAFASAEDPDFPASELNYHSPETRGWLSPKFCEYPQEIGIRFVDGNVELTQVQLLSHQSKIATKIELYIGHGPDYYNAKFKRLGYLSLDSNERSNYKARELKSVYIQAKGSFLKLLIHQCHSNPHNLYNQVGLIALNTLGRPLPEGSVSQPSTATQSRSSKQHKPKKSSSNVEDLAVDMKMDPSTASILRQVHERKLAAVEEEDYVLAKQYKTVEDHLKQVGGELSELMSAKSQAVEEEDYDEAARLKQSIDRMRGQIQAQIDAIEHGNFARFQQPTEPHYGGAPYGQQPQHQAYGYPPQQAYAPPQQPTYAEPPHPNQSFSAAPQSNMMPQQYGDSHNASWGAPQSPSRNPYAQGGNGSHASISHSGSPPRQSGEYQEGDHGPAKSYPAPSGYSQEPMYDYEEEGGVSPHQPAAEQPTGDPHLDKPLRGPANSDFYAKAAQGEIPLERPGSRQIHPGNEKAFEVAQDQPAESEASKAGASSKGGGAAVPAAEGEKADPSELAGVEGVDELPAPEPIPSNEHADATPLIEVFGEYVVRCLLSKSWNLREVAIQKIQLEIPNYTNSKSQIFEAVCNVITRITNRDRIAQVFVSSIQLIPVVLDTCAPHLRKSELLSKLEPVCSALVEMLGDNQGKKRDTAVDALLELASRENIGPAFVANFCMKKLSKKQEQGWRAMHTRLMVLSMLVADHNLLNHGIGPEQLIDFSVKYKAHAHANGELRDSAKQLCVEIFKVIGSKIEEYLGHLRRKQLEEYREGFEMAKDEQQMAANT
eukprot:gb/GECG01001837.1/.p1 GENE.gb/GECG01001837.1/~~gb/GECG01001837.1/.p1  ORF type:complete len:831 (+),score=125.56 gb/GECG01001837.1/:1-2493(+)